MQLSLANSGLPRVSRLLRRAALYCSIAVAAGLLAAQAPPRAKPHHAAKPAAAHARHSKAVKAHDKTPEIVTTPPATPPAPSKPNWPADQPATPPTITWDSHGLEIKAANSSLQQILSEVATNTGAKVTGLSHDERVFGVYGPAPAREVLSQLLHGTSYNVLMLGDQGEGTPRVVILSARAAPGPQPQVQNPPQPQENDELDNQQGGEPGPPSRIMPGNQPQPMTPQDRWRQMQEQRQRQMQQQIEEQQGPPPQ